MMRRYEVEARQRVETPNGWATMPERQRYQVDARDDKDALVLADLYRSAILPDRFNCAVILWEVI